MTQVEKKALWDELKGVGVEFTRHYREYTTAELEAAVVRLHLDQLGIPTPEPASIPYAGNGEQYMADTSAPMPSSVNERWEEPYEGRRPPLSENSYEGNFPVSQPSPSPAPFSAEGTDVAGTQSTGNAVRVDELGRTWFQDEVRKPGFAKPRGRKKLTYNDPGVKQVTIRNGDYTETYEMPGDEVDRQMEARITLPAYQVGVYQSPAYPFKVHCYNNAEGFDFFEVNSFYGGADLVPEGIKRIYVSSTLCYDMRTTIREIEAEGRELLLRQQRAGVQ